MIWLDFPATPASPAASIPHLDQALGVKIVQVGRTQFDYLVELDSESTVRSLTPNLALVASLPVRGVIVTAQSDSGEHDFVSRFFAPQSGVPEDPVTGGAHCGLAPFWAERLNKSVFRAFQASRRGGEIGCVLRGDRVELQGTCVFYLEGNVEI